MEIEIKEPKLNGRLKEIVVGKYKPLLENGKLSIGPRIDEFGVHELTIVDELGRNIFRQTFDVDGSVQNSFSFIYDGNNLVEELWYNGESNFRLKKTHKYNCDNQLIEQTEALKNGFINKKQICYNENGDCIEMNEQMSDGRSTTHIYQYKYDLNGNKIEIFISNSNGRFLSRETNTYNDKNEVIAFNSYDEYGKIKTAQILKYDDNGNLVQDNRFDETGKLTDSFNYQFDNFGNKIERRWNRPAWDISTKSTYEYNENGLLLKENIFSRDGSLSKIVTLEYEFDNKNNWIRKIKIENGSPEVITVRDIKYFDA